MRRTLACSSLVVVAAVLGCGSTSADDLFTKDKFGVVVGGTVSFGGAQSLGGSPGSGGSLSGGGGGAAGATSAGRGGTVGSGGAAGAAAGGVVGTGGSSLGGAAGKGGAAGSAGKGGSGTGGMPGKTCEELLNALPSLLSAAQACTPSASAPPCNGFVKNQCGCMVAVNDTASTQDKSYTEAVAALLTQCGVNCGDVVCATVTAAACVTSGSGSAGNCLGR
jgi:hypothetical protein